MEGACLKGPLDPDDARAVSESTSPLRLNLGCGAVHPAGWVNVDASLGARLAKIPWLGRAVARFLRLRVDWSPHIRVHDLRRPFPWRDGSAHTIYSSHTLEHLTREDGRRFLAECHRVLAPGGVLRIVVPDLSRTLSGYQKGEFPADQLLDRLGVGFTVPGDGAWKRRMAPLFRHPHRCMYDAASLIAALEETGFLDARVHPPELSRIRELADVEKLDRARGALVVECVKLARDRL